MWCRDVEISHGVGHQKCLIELNILLLVYSKLLLELSQLILSHVHSKEGTGLFKELMLCL